MPAYILASDHWATMSLLVVERARQAMRRRQRRNLKRATINRRDNLACPVRHKHHVSRQRCPLTLDLFEWSASK
jgi:hypothetical protein